MPKIVIKKATVTLKRHKGRPQKVTASVKGNPDDDKVTLKVKGGDLTEEKLELLLAQNARLCTRVALLEAMAQNTWYRRLWRFMNKPIGRI